VVQHSALQKRKEREEKEEKWRDWVRLPLNVFLAVKLCKRGLSEASFETTGPGLACNSMIEHLSCMLEDLGPIPALKNKQTKKM
jgi:hypothetical protein